MLPDDGTKYKLYDCTTKIYCTQQAVKCLDTPLEL